MKTTKDINFECIADLADELVGEVMHDEDLCISVVGRFEEIRLLLIELMRWDSVWFDWLNLSSPEYNGYEDEYILSLWHNDGMMQIGCEPAKIDDAYIHITGDAIYVFENCSSKILNKCNTNEIYYVSIGDKCDDCNYDPKECSCECDDCCKYDKAEVEIDEDIHGFTVTKDDNDGYCRVSYYTSEDLDKKYISSLLKRFGF